MEKEKELIYTRIVLWTILVLLTLPIIEVIFTKKNLTIIDWQVSLVLGVGIYGLIRMVNLIIKQQNNL
jgi:hypothetical protein